MTVSVIDRRSFLAGSLAAVAAPLSVEAQPTRKAARIGYLGDNPTPSPQLREAFLQGMSELGYVEGRNLVIEYGYAEGNLDRYDTLAAELVTVGVDIIFAAGGTSAALAAGRATKTIPVVFSASSDPVGTGLVKSIAKPGGNITGSTFFTPELLGKCLQLLKETVPPLRAAAVLAHQGDRAQPILLKGAQATAAVLGVRLQSLNVRDPKAFETAFSTMVAAGAEALIVSTSAMLINERVPLVALAAKHRLPTMYAWRQGADAGGLISYAPDLRELFHRAASYVDKILKGAKPADLPIEQPTKFELVINLKTAKALGLTISPSLLARADQVIE